MPNFKGKFFSIVFIGNLNPQILTHDFLINHEIIPLNQEPFKELLAKKDVRPYTNFISTPAFTSISYGPISIIIEQNRYQIMDTRFTNQPFNTIIEITQKYFGKLLRFTPFQLGGINLNGIIQFANVDDEQVFDKSFGISRDNLSKIIGSGNFRTGISFNFAWENGFIEVSVSKPKKPLQQGILNYNYEFDFKNIDSFLGNLGNFEKFYTKFNSFLSSFGLNRT